MQFKSYYLHSFITSFCATLKNMNKVISKYKNFIRSKYIHVYLNSVSDGSSVHQIPLKSLNAEIPRQVLTNDVDTDLKQVCISGLSYNFEIVIVHTETENRRIYKNIYHHEYTKKPIIYKKLLRQI